MSESTSPTRPCVEHWPDHNGECQNCDEWLDAHTPEAVERGGLRAERDVAVRGWAESMQRNLELQAEIARLRALVDAVGEKVCEVALRINARYGGGKEPADD